jgi:hypothetical protein
MQRKASGYLNGLEDSGSGHGGWHEDNTGIALRCLLSLKNDQGSQTQTRSRRHGTAYISDCVEDGQVQVSAAALAGRNAAHHFGAVLNGLGAVEGTLQKKTRGVKSRDSSKTSMESVCVRKA